MASVPQSEGGQTAQAANSKNSRDNDIVITDHAPRLLPDPSLSTRLTEVA
jgi:hypothetical protein